MRSTITGGAPRGRIYSALQRSRAATTAVVAATVLAMLMSGGVSQAAAPNAVARPITTFACPAEQVPSANFVDTEGNTFTAEIACLAWYRITSGGVGGLPANHYGPSLVVRRDQMASFLARVLDYVDPDLLGPYDGRNDFVDVDAGNVHAAAINRLRDAGVVVGGPGGRPANRFGPELTVTREQMATFINRTYGRVHGGEGLTAVEDYFDDDAGSIHEDNINALAVAGIVGGRSPRTYAPGAVVRRDAMSAFIMRTMDLFVGQNATAPPGASQVDTGGGGGGGGTVARQLSFAAPRSFPVGDRPGSIAVADLDGDASLDLVVANGEADTISVLLGTGSGGLVAAADVAVGGNPRWVATADLNADGHADLVVLTGPGGIAVLLGTGNGSYGSATEFVSGISPVSLATGDVNGDETVDVVVADIGSPSCSDAVLGDVRILAGAGDGTFGQPTAIEVGNGPTAVAVGDFDGDGHSDLAATIGCDTERGLAVMLGAGDGTFLSASHHPVVHSPTTLEVADFDGDGHSDLAVVGLGSGDGTGAGQSGVSVLLATGEGTFSPAARHPAGSLPFSLAVADFNLDGHPDVAVAAVASDTVVVLLGVGDGSLGGGRHFTVGSQPVRLAVGDLDADGRPDMAVVNQNSDDVSVLMNTSE